MTWAMEVRVNLCKWAMILCCAAFPFILPASPKFIFPNNMMGIICFVRHMANSRNAFSQADTFFRSGTLCG